MSIPRHALLWLILLSTLSSLWGCGPARPVARIEAGLPAEFPGHALVQIESLVRASSDTLIGLRARASLSLATPQRSGRFSSEIRERRNDSLYIALSPGLGIEAVRILVTPDSVFLFNRIENELTYGSMLEAGGLIPIPVDLGSLFQNLSGTLVPVVGPAWTVTPIETTYQLMSPDRTRLYIVDPRIWRVIRFEQRTPEGELVEERVFSAFTEIDGVYVPQQLHFRRPLEESAVALTYRRVEVNPDGMSFDLNVRSDTQRVRIGSE